MKREAGKKGMTVACITKCFTSVSKKYVKKENMNVLPTQQKFLKEVKHCLPT
jgi:hypothetical protein